MQDKIKCAVILAGGLGSRLHPYTLTIPKPLLPIGGIPIIEIVINQLVNQGFEKVIITLGHLGEMIKFVIGDGKRFNIEIEYVIEHKPLGTAGSLFLIENLPKKFLVMNGDLLTTFSYSTLLESLNSNEIKACVACCRRNVHVDYGVLKKDSSNILLEYIEKPNLDYLVSMGIYALNSEVLSILNGQRMDMPNLLEKIKSSFGKVLLLESQTYWQDIGRISDFEKASQDFEQNPRKFLNS